MWDLGADDDQRVQGTCRDPPSRAVFDGPQNGYFGSESAAEMRKRVARAGVERGYRGSERDTMTRRRVSPLHCNEHI